MNLKHSPLNMCILILLKACTWASSQESLERMVPFLYKSFISIFKSKFNNIGPIPEGKLNGILFDINIQPGIATITLLKNNVPLRRDHNATKGPNLFHLGVEYKKVYLKLVKCQLFPMVSADFLSKALI
ncbi:hypothetical protein F8M41_001479 [Gigaspora margarita]|uniref:Uncharacterized protein n=1 Tax=Gigaspora margarita TaxID=4874 RepID=A0A8H4A919_GIGMA|nr:hypothetical protein F8M41_001479 [Gigaspora margarita]